jgi:hypothetical protein
VERTELLEEKIEVAGRDHGQHGCRRIAKIPEAMHSTARRVCGVAPCQDASHSIDLNGYLPIQYVEPLVFV